MENNTIARKAFEEEILIMNESLAKKTDLFARLESGMGLGDIGQYRNQHMQTAWTWFLKGYEEAMGDKK